MTKILFVDDDHKFVNAAKEFWKRGGGQGTKIEFHHSTERLLNNPQKIREASIIVADLRLKLTSGLDFLDIVRNQNKNAKLFLITGQLILEEEQKRCKRLEINIIFKTQDIEILFQNILFLSKERIPDKRKHVFISYRRADFKGKIEPIVKYLRDNDIDVWIDRESIMPGQDWQIAIREAIKNGMFFLACFSQNYWSENRNYMNEELQLAISELRQMPDDSIWFIPIKLDSCDIPNLMIRENKAIDSKQFIDLNNDWENGLGRIVNVIRN